MPPERMAAALYVLTQREKQGGSASGQLTLLRLLLISHRQITAQAVPGSSQPPLGHSAAFGPRWPVMLCRPLLKPLLSS